MRTRLCIWPYILEFLSQMITNYIIVSLAFREKTAFNIKLYLYLKI